MDPVVAASQPILVRRALVSCLSSDDAAAVNASVKPVGWEAVLALATELRLAPAVVAQLRVRGAAPPIPALRLPNGQQTVTARFDELWNRHLARRARLTERTVELVAAMNAAGIEPVLLKGVRSLATTEPAWRTMRDLDLLVPGAAAHEANAVAQRLGYAAREGSTEKAGKHHFQPLFRKDMPGWIEIHKKAATHRAEQLLPTAVLLEGLVPITIGGARARIFGLPGHTLHALVHHHVGHRGDKDGTIDTKGLFEFAADVRGMDAGERAGLVALAARHPRLVATLELWLAAAQASFDLPVATPFTLDADAIAHAAAASERLAGEAGHYDGLADELRLASARHRLVRQPGGRTPWGRAALRARVVGSMLTPMINLFGEA